MSDKSKVNTNEYPQYACWYYNLLVKYGSVNLKDSDKKRYLFAYSGESRVGSYDFRKNIGLIGNQKEGL